MPGKIKMAFWVTMSPYKGPQPCMCVYIKKNPWSFFVYQKNWFSDQTWVESDLECRKETIHAELGQKNRASKTSSGIPKICWVKCKHYFTFHFNSGNDLRVWHWWPEWRRRSGVVDWMGWRPRMLKVHSLWVTRDWVTRDSTGIFGKIVDTQ